MVNKALSGLAAVPTDTGDDIYLVRNGNSRRGKVGTAVATGLSSLPVISLADDAADYVPAYDASAGIWAKVLGKNLGFTQAGSSVALRSLQSKLREQCISPDDCSGATDSAKVMAAFAKGIAEDKGVSLGFRDYTITDPVLIPTIAFVAAGTSHQLRIYSDGARLLKSSTADNTAVLATANWHGNSSVYTDPFAIFGELTIDGGGVATNGLVAMCGQEFVPARLTIVNCTRGLVKPGTTSNGTAYNVFGGGFHYPNLNIHKNARGVVIEEPTAPAYYTDYELGGDVYGNSIQNINTAQTAGARIHVRTFFLEDSQHDTDPVAAQSCYFENPLLADFAGSFFGCELGTIPGSKFTYSTNTAASDPGSGGIKFNNATLASATECYVSETDADSTAVATILQVWAAAGTRVTLAREATASLTPTFMSFTITGSVDNGTWRTLTIGSLVVVGTLSNGNTARIAPEARCAAEFVVAEGNLNLRGAQIQNGDAVVSFASSSYYQHALVSCCEFTGIASLRHATNNSAKKIFSLGCQFDTGTYRFQSGTSHAGTIEARFDHNIAQATLITGIQSPTDTAVDHVFRLDAAGTLINQGSGFWQHELRSATSRTFLGVDANFGYVGTYAAHPFLLFYNNAEQFRLNGTGLQAAAGKAIQTAQGAGNTLLLQAYDVNGAAYVTFGTLTANDTPTFDLVAAVTMAGGTIWNSGNDGAGSGLDADLLDGKTTGTSGNTVPLLDGTNTWSGAQTISVTASFATPLTVTGVSDDNGGPTARTFHESASPAANDFIGTFAFDGRDSGGAVQRYALFQAQILDPTAASEDGRLNLSAFIAGAETPVIQIGPRPHMTNATTTASAANAFLDAGSSPVNEILRSTSAARYKRDVEDLEDKYADALLGARPVWYRSKCEHDNPDHSFYGFIAEEVAAIDPRLVAWGYADEDYEETLIDLPPIPHEKMVEVIDPETEERRLEKVVELHPGGYRRERKLKDGAKLVPDGVAYDRFVVMHNRILQKQRTEIQTLAARLAALEQALATKH